MINLNKTEIKGYNWLLSKGYSINDIKFQCNITPDFLTSDGKGWEIKRIFARNKIFMSVLQFKRIKQMVDTQVVIFNDESAPPIFTIASNMIIVGKIHDGIHVIVPKNSVTKSLNITQKQEDWLIKNDKNFSRYVRRKIDEDMEVDNEQAHHTDCTVTYGT